MNNQKNILLVTNSTTQSEIILIKEAMDSAKAQGLTLKLNLVHVIPNLPTCYFNIPSMVVLTERYYEEATKTLIEVGNELSVSKKDQWLITGRIRTEVLRLADKLDTHYILASSTNIQDLHKSFLFAKRAHNNTPIRSIGSIVNF